MSNELSIEDIITDFGEVYREVKGYKDPRGLKHDGWETILKDAQKQFFEAATRELEQSTLARKTLSLPEMEYQNEEGAKEYISLFNPGWRLVEIKKDKAILEEDPEVKTFAYLNLRDGMVYKRSQVQTGPSLDVDRLREENLDLYTEISMWSPSIYDAVRDAMVWAYDSVKNPSPETLATEETEKFLVAQPQSDSLRIILNPSQWTPEQASALQDYLIPGKISVRLTPPRPAKDSEIETGEVDES